MKKTHEMIAHTSEVFNRFEFEGRFNDDINPEPWETAIPVTKDFPFVPDEKLAAKYRLQQQQNAEIVKGFCDENKISIGINGEGNMKNLEKGAVVVGNHYCVSIGIL
jgi:hypothetical protein